MTSIFQILSAALSLLWFIIIAHIIMSWLVNFQVLNIRQPLVAQIWYGLNRILEPIYSKIRKILPAMGGLDLAPMVLIFGIFALRVILANNIGAFG
ncbi:MAG: YggT family protein [Rhodobacteraceae bacterium]|nr:YggT family protein [Paracoccaceae bacterium]